MIKPVKRASAILGATLVVVAVAAVVIWPVVGDDLVSPLIGRYLGGWFAPDAGRPQEGAVETVPQVADGLAAQVMWSSNRTGNHELWLMDLGDGTRSRLTDHPNVDFYARFSPDGERVVFTRSRREWVSFREVDAWDVWLMDSDGSKERRIAEHGYHPEWTADGEAVVFVRGDRLVRWDLETEAESVVFDASARSMEIRYGDAAVSGDGSRVAAAVGGGAAIVTAVEPGGEVFVLGEDACQATWGPGDEFLLWIEGEGHGGNRVVRSAPDGGRSEVLIDLPGSFSHEYFPRLSDDGRWLVWAASAGGHEHDRADYELFLWRVGTAWEEASRLTFHSGNDQWPDIRLLPAGR